MIINHNCHGCAKPVAEVGKLIRIGYASLCRYCRTAYKRGKLDIDINKARTKTRLSGLVRPI